MTKQEFLIETAIYYYLRESNTEEVFNFLPEKAKNKLIKSNIDDGDNLEDWEILWCSRNKPGFFKTHIKYLVEDCYEDLTDRQLNILDVEWVVYYFDLVYKVYNLDFFEKHYEPKFKKYKAKMRDKKIDQILED